MLELHITLITEDADRLLEIKRRAGEDSHRVRDMTIEEYAKELLTDAIRRRLPETPHKGEPEPREAEELAEIIAEAVHDQIEAEAPDQLTRDALADIIADIVITDTMPDEI